MKLWNSLISAVLPVVIGASALHGCGGNDETGAVGTAPLGSSETVEIGASGTSVDLLKGKLALMVPPEALTAPTTIDATEVPMPEGLPAGIRGMGNGIEIKIGNQAVVDQPLQFAVAYDAAASGVPIVMHYSAGSGYSPATTLRRDAEKGLIYFESRSFSTFGVTVLYDPIPESHHVKNAAGVLFDPAVHAFSINNVDYPALNSDCGSCMGMSAVVRSQFSRTDRLFTGYTPQVQTVLAILAHAGINWEKRLPQALADTSRPDGEVVEDVKALLALDEPIVLWMRKPSGGAHAVLVFAYNDTHFSVYDPNFPGQTVKLPYSAAGLAPYRGFSKFGYYVVETSIAPKIDIDKLLDLAALGFTGSASMSIDTPAESEILARRRGDMNGSVTNSDIKSLKLITRAGQQDIEPSGGRFFSPFPVFSGANYLILLGGPANVSQLTSARSGGVVRSVFNPLPPAELFAMTTWKSNADLDLYVYSPSGAVAWYGERTAAGGMVLDIDDQKRGPELVTLSTQDPENRGTIEGGDYRVRVHYFKGVGAVDGEALVALNEYKGPNRDLCRIKFSIPLSNENNDQPGDTGDGWLDVARVDLVNNLIFPTPPHKCDQPPVFVEPASARSPTLAVAESRRGRSQARAAGR